MVTRSHAADCDLITYRSRAREASPPRHPALATGSLSIAVARRGVRARRRRAACCPSGAGWRSPGQLVPEDVELEVAAAPAFVSRGGIKLANALDALGLDVGGALRARRRRLDGRLHRLPAAARRGARGRRRRRLRRARLAAALGPARDRDRAHRTRGRSAPATLPYRPDLIVIDVSFISLAQGAARRCSPAPPSGSTAWRWSSRSSRSAASTSARAAWSARRRWRRQALDRGRHRRVASSAPRCSASRAPGCPARRATSRRSSGSPRLGAPGVDGPRPGRARGRAVNPVRTATVLTHRRPSETAPALDMLIELAREAGRRAALRRRGDPQARARPSATGVELDAPISQGRRHLLRARRRRHDPDRAADVRRDRRPGVRGQLRRDRLPRDGRSRRRAGGHPARVRGRLRGAAAARDLVVRRDAARGWRSTTSRCTASPASASPTSRTRSAATRSGACAATASSSPRPPARPATTSPTAGPVMAWGVEGFVVSFIAPHSLTARALVVAPQDVLAVHNRSQEEPVDVTVDGRPVCVLAPGEQIAARFADDQGALAQIPGATFYQRLREKFGRLASAPRSVGPSDRGWYTVVHAARAARREPAADGAGRAAARAGPERADRRDRAPARRCSRTRSTCCSAAARVAGSCARAPPRRTSRACSRCRRGSTRSAIERIPAGRRGDRARAARVARRADARLRLRPLGDARRPARARQPAAVVLRPARAPQADARRGPARDPRRPLRSGAGRRCAARAGRVRTSACATLEAEIAELRALAGARDRELDLVAFELDEIEAVAPSEEEEAELDRRARSPAPPRDAARGGRGRRAEAIAPETRGDGVAVARWPAAAQQLEQAAGIDRGAGARCPSGCRRCASRPRTSAASCARYLLGIEGAPGRLEEVEERLALFARLRAQARRHRSPTSCATPSAAASGADELEHADVALEEAEAELAERSGRARRLAGALRRAPARRRAGAGGGGARAARASWRCRTPGSRSPSRPAPDGCGPRGADAVEFSIAPERRAARPAPLREIASGGELSRVMLALLSVAHGEDASDATPSCRRRPLLVFDEIDAGDRRAHGARRRRAPARARRRAPDPLHHPSAAGGRARPAPLHDRQGRRPRDPPGHDGRDARGRRGRRRARPDARRRRGRPRGQPARAAAAEGGVGASAHAPPEGTR